MNASDLPKGQSNEVSSDGRLINLPGIYVHTETGSKFITAAGDEGVVQADAIERQGGFERVGDVPSRVELLKMNKAQLVKDETAKAVEKGLDATAHKAAVKEAKQKAQDSIDELKVTETKAKDADGKVPAGEEVEQPVN